MPPRITRRIGMLALTAVAAIPALVDVAAAAVPEPRAEAARVCAAPRYPGSGYFTSLTVKRVGCAAGKRVTLAHYRCRTRGGRAGRCGRRVLGYRCKETRRSIATEIQARVTCRRGARTVIYTYQQNL